MFNARQPSLPFGTYHRPMTEAPPRPLTRPLCVGLICGAALLCLPPSGFAEPIWISNMTSVARFQSLFDVLDNDHLGTYVGAADQDDELAVLAADLREAVQADLIAAMWARNGSGR